MVILVTRERSVIILMAPQGSGRERELDTLFQIGASESSLFEVRSFDAPMPLDFVAAGGR